MTWWMFESPQHKRCNYVIKELQQQLKGLTLISIKEAVSNQSPTFSFANPQSFIRYLHIQSDGLSRQSLHLNNKIKQFQALCFKCDNEIQWNTGVFVFFRYWYIPVANKSTWTDPGPVWNWSAKPRHKDLHFCVAKERNQTNCISGCPKSVFEPNDGVVNGKHSKICCESTLQIKLIKTIKYSLPRKNESDMWELSWKTSKFWCLSAEKNWGEFLVSASLSHHQASDWSLPVRSTKNGSWCQSQLINGNFLREISLFPHPSNPLPFVLCAKCAWYICGARPSNKGGKLVLWRRCLATWEHLPRIRGGFENNTAVVCDLPLAASSPNHPPNNDSQLTRSGIKPEVQALRSRAGQVEGHHPIAIGQWSIKGETVGGLQHFLFEPERSSKVNKYKDLKKIGIYKNA